MYCVKLKLMMVIELFNSGSIVTENGILVSNFWNKIRDIRIDFKHSKNLQISAIVSKIISIFRKFNHNFLASFDQDSVQCFQIFIFVLYKFQNHTFLLIHHSIIESCFLSISIQFIGIHFRKLVIGLDIILRFQHERWVSLPKL